MSEGLWEHNYGPGTAVGGECTLALRRAPPPRPFTPDDPCRSPLHAPLNLVDPLGEIAQPRRVEHRHGLRADLDDARLLELAEGARQDLGRGAALGGDEVLRRSTSPGVCSRPAARDRR
jgi:hypothetical protein